MTRRLELQEDSSRARGDADAAGALNRLQTIFDGAAVGIVHIDADGHALYSNAEAQALLGYTREEMLELAVGDVVHPDQQDAQGALHAELVTGRRSAYELEKRYLRKDGSDLWAFSRTTAVAAEPGERPTAVVVIQDITERKEIELELRRNTDRLAQTVETLRDIAAAGVDLETVLDLICERAMALTGSDGAIVSLVEGDQLLVAGARGIVAELLHERRPLAGSIVRHAIDAHDTLLIRDTVSDPRINQKMQKRVGDFSLICVPLFAGDEPVAALNVMSRDFDHRLGDEERQTLELLAVALSAAVSRAAEFDARRRQVAALARFEATFAGSVAGMLLADPRGRIVETNAAFQDMLGYDAEALRGSEVADFTAPEDQQTTRATLTGMAERGDAPVRAEHRFVRRDGAIVWVNLSLSLVRGESVEESFTIGVVQDVTQRRKAEQALLAQSELNEYQALHDGLTGLANRTLFGDRIEREIRTARRDGKQLAVVVMDLDRFKEINDSLGHAAGDALLIEVGQRLEAALRESDTVARLGGDEFGLLLPGVDMPADVMAAMERVRAEIGRPVIVDGLPLVVEGSIGIAVFPEDGDDVETLVQHADVAMYHAKEKNSGWAFYDASTARHDPGRLTLVGELRGALERHELVLHYQPKAFLADGQVRSVEALVRWQHPVRGLVQPDDFIPLVQQTGLIKPLTRYVIDEALRQARAWSEQGWELSIAVNLSTRNLLDVEFPEQVAELLAHHEVEPRWLELEITESTMLEDPPRTKAVLERLSAMGIRLSIDDFGTGYSSLAYLTHLPIDEIKIDRSFVMNMVDNEDDATIVRSTIDLGRNLGLEVVAEGVESGPIWDQLTDLGCTVAQGYFLSPPVPADELTPWLQRRRDDAARAA